MSNIFLLHPKFSLELNFLYSRFLLSQLKSGFSPQVNHKIAPTKTSISFRLLNPMNLQHCGSLTYQKHQSFIPSFLEHLWLLGYVILAFFPGSLDIIPYLILVLSLPLQQILLFFRFNSQELLILLTLAQLLYTLNSSPT